MLLRQIIRHLIYAPTLSGARKTFLHFYWNGYSWSLRDFSDPRLPPKPLYWADLHLTVEQILALAHGPGAFCLGAPTHPVSDVRFWHERTVEANRAYLGIASVARASPAVTPARPPISALPKARPLGIEQSGYQAGLREAFWRYRDAEFAGADDLFDDYYQPGGAQPPVFKTEHAWRNVLLRPNATRDETVMILSALPPGRHHKWFRSMTSSQALTQSVFANLDAHGKLGLLTDLLGEDGLPPFPSGLVGPRGSRAAEHPQLEYQVNYLGEPRPTSVDLMFDGGYRIAVECKLAESDVGWCSRPGMGPSAANYEIDYCSGAYARQRGRQERCTLTERDIAYWSYIPKLLTWPADADMQPCPLRPTYQLVRNILAACVLPNGTLDPAGHAVLLYDARNPAFAVGGKGHRAWQAVRSSLRNPEHLRRCTWQELTACLARDDDLRWLTDALREKYEL